MKVNPSLMSVRKLPGNVYDHLEFVRKQQESAPIVAWSIGLALMVCLFVVAFQSCGLAGGIR